MTSAALYDFILDVLRAQPTSAEQRRRAFAVDVGRWHRILGFDGCTVQFDRALRRAGHVAETPTALRRLLRDATSQSLHRALLVQAQITEVAELAAIAGIRVMALKGAARLLAGEMPGGRSLADIDLLTDPRDSARLHTLLRRDLGYATSGEPYPHHLAGLTRPGSLGIEVHVRLTPTVLPLDRTIWDETRHAAVGGHSIELPSATSMLLHTLEHAVRVNWTARYRLRDILDVAALLGTDVDADVVDGYVAASDCHRAMRRTVEAARSLHSSRTPRAAAAWRTVRRVGRTRITLATWPRAPRLAERCFRYAGVIAEGSPRVLGRAGLGLVRRLTAGTAALALLGVVSGCDNPVMPDPPVVGAFVFSSQSGGHWALYRFREGVATRLSAPGNDDREPHSVGSQVVFTSLRDGDAEIYGATLNADLTLGTQTRLTTEYGLDAEPALSPSGATIAFVSERSGAPRIWLMNANGGNPTPLATGSDDYVPEGSPRWSPSGDRIVFTSTRTGTSQVYSVAATGGVASQLSHESRGAFTPSWLPDGRNVLYTAVSGAGQVMSVPATGGDARVFATDAQGLGEAACSTAFCLAVAAPLGGVGHVVALTVKGKPTPLVFPQVADDHRPAILAH